VRKNLEVSYAKYKQQADASRVEANFDVGDLMWVYLSVIDINWGHTTS
jgi:hypothetical protein